MAGSQAQGHWHRVTGRQGGGSTGAATERGAGQACLAFGGSSLHGRRPSVHPARRVCSASRVRKYLGWGVRRSKSMAVLFGYSSTLPPNLWTRVPRMRASRHQRRATSWVACVGAPPRRFRHSPAGTPRWHRAAGLRQNAGLHHPRRSARRPAVTAPASCSITTEVAPAGCVRPDRHAHRRVSIGAPTATARRCTQHTRGGGRRR